MLTAIVTTVYNERVNLPIWVRHYSSHCPGATLFVIDHGSNDGSTRGLGGVNVLPLPRRPWDGRARSDFAADLQHALLRFFDFVIYTDCDEMLVADPRKHASLAAFLEAVDSDVVSPTGLNVQHIIALEAPIDLNAPILGQRRYVRFASGMCKPSISRVPLLWMPGFHWCDQLSEHRTDLFQFHLRRMDVNLSLERLRTTREMAWSEQALLAGGESWRQADEERVRVEFEIPAELARTHGLVPFEFENEMKRRFDSLRLQDGFYKGEHFRGLITEVPETFFGLI